MVWQFWVGNALTLSISVIGWIITAVSGRRAGKTQARQFEKSLAVQRQHVATLSEQVRLLRQRADVPHWTVRQDGSRGSVIFVIRNGGTFDAFDVRLEFNESDEIPIGDVSCGSERSFEFMEILMMGGVRTDLTVSWSTSQDGLHRDSVTVVPERPAD